MGDWPRNTEVAQKVWDLGFEYDATQNIIKSRMGAWQHGVGFTWAYDCACPALLMDIDCEPVYFSHGGRDWMVEFWKGQYGIETGGEIGVYRTDTKVPSTPAAISSLASWFPGVAKAVTGVKRSGEFFGCATGPKEMLTLEYTLLRAGEPFIHRGAEPHWWLTGFKWGVFTNSEELRMVAKISFTDAAMLKAFQGGLEELKYPTAADKGTQTITVTFDRPRTPQPTTRGVAQAAGLRSTNDKLVKRYVALQQDLGLLTNDPAHSNDPNRFDASKIATTEGKDGYAALLEFLGKLDEGKTQFLKIWNAL